MQLIHYIAVTSYGPPDMNVIQLRHGCLFHIFQGKTFKSLYLHFCWTYRIGKHTFLLFFSIQGYEINAVFSFICSDSQKCLINTTFWGGKGNIAFVGDSRIRRLYAAFINTTRRQDINLDHKHGDFQYTDPSSNTKIVSGFIFRTISRSGKHVIHETCHFISYKS